MKRFLTATVLALALAVAAVVLPVGDIIKVYAANQQTVAAVEDGTANVTANVGDTLVITGPTSDPSNWNGGTTGLTGGTYHREGDAGATVTGIQVAGTITGPGTITFTYSGHDYTITITVPTAGGGAAAAAAETVAPPCTHDFEWVIAVEPTEKEDGIEEHKCKYCGAVDKTNKISAYIAFNRNTANKIKKAGAGATVTIETDRWVSFHKMVFDELAKRPDVTLVTDYSINHIKYEMTIPAGAYADPENAATTLDENGYAGFGRLASLYPTVAR